MKIQKKEVTTRIFAEFSEMEWKVIKFAVRQCRDENYSFRFYHPHSFMLGIDLIKLCEEMDE